jgi:hypothetical protein
MLQQFLLLSLVYLLQLKWTEHHLCNVEILHLTKEDVGTFSVLVYGAVLASL